MTDVLTIGELLIDFTPVSSPDCSNLFQANPGGAPANVAVQLSNLGINSGFIGKVGNDRFGKMLIECLDEHGVSTEDIIVDKSYNTTLAFVHLNENGDRSFTFYRNPGADTQLKFDEVDLKLIDDCRILHFGSLSFTTEPSRSTTIKVLEYAKAKGKFLSYDPNWRPLLWSSKEYGIESMKMGLKYCDILKVSDEELFLLTGKEDITQGIGELLKLGIKIVVVTSGANGCAASCCGDIRYVPGYDVKAIDTTGCGDSFLGALLGKLIESGKPISEIGINELVQFCSFANASGAVCATRRGAIPAMPHLYDIQQFQRLNKKITGDNRSLQG